MRLQMKFVESRAAQNGLKLLPLYEWYQVVRPDGKHGGHQQLTTGTLRECWNFIQGYTQGVHNAKNQD